jgi:hypothetical protein
LESNTTSLKSDKTAVDNTRVGPKNKLLKNAAGVTTKIPTITKSKRIPVRVVRDGTVKASGNVNANAEVKNSAEAKEFAVKRAGLGGFLDRIFARKAVAARADIQASQ